MSGRKKIPEPTSVDGYIIVNRDWSPRIQLDMGMSSFAMSAADAWRRHVGPRHAISADFPVIVQRWSDKGYGPARVSATLATPTRQ